MSDGGAMPAADDVTLSFVLATVARVFELEQVPHTSGFFELGGDSLLALELTAALSDEGWLVTVDDIIDTASWEDLARRLVRR